MSLLHWHSQSRVHFFVRPRVVHLSAAAAAACRHTGWMSALEG